MFKLDRFKRTDVPLVVAVILLCIAGATNVFSTTFFPDARPSELFINQLLFYFVGFTIFFIFTTFDYQKLKNGYIQFLTFAASIGLLIAVLFIGELVYGARRWISFGSFTLQPSEFVKLSMVMIVSFLIAKHHRKQSLPNNKYHTLPGTRITNNKEKSKFINLINNINWYDLSFWLKIFIVWGSFAFLIIRQNSLGNTILLTGVLAVMLFFYIDFSYKTFFYIFFALLGFNTTSGLLSIGEGVAINELIQVNLLTVVIIIIGILLLVWKLKLSIVFSVVVFIFALTLTSGVNYAYTNVLQQYQRDRIEVFVNPSSDKNQGLSWNRQQSLIAIGSATIVGKGFLNGTQSNYKYLPFSFTDFAYAAFVEQFGLPGTVFVISILAFIVLRIMNIASSTDEIFGRMLCYGIAALIFLNMVQHTGMNLGVLPITGVPLPFISYGGSYIITIFIGLGFVISVHNNPYNKVSIVNKINPILEKESGGNLMNMDLSKMSRRRKLRKRR